MAAFFLGLCVGAALGVAGTWFSTHADDRQRLFSAVKKLAGKDQPPAA